MFVRAFALAVEFGFIIAIPLVIFGLLGKYLDNRLHTHYILLLGVLLALGASTAALWIRFRQIIKDMKQN